MVTQKKIFETNSTNSKQVLVLLNKTGYLFYVKWRLYFLSGVGGKTKIGNGGVDKVGNYR